MASRCTALPCANYGNAARGGLCNACASGAPLHAPLHTPARALGDDDDALALALAASAAEHSSTISEPLVSQTYAIARADVPPTCGTGQLVQVGVLNQFHARWGPLIAEHRAPSAICGYMVLAHASILSTLAAAGTLPLDAPSARAALCDAAAVEVRVAYAMGAIARARSRYISTHSFTSGAEEAYLRAWVANYEISDVLRAGDGAFALTAAASATLIFVRFNQMHEVGEAKHEELTRLVAEEAPFGKETFIVETFDGREHRLLRATEALVERDASAWRVACVDVNGHFAIAIAVGTDTLLLNTTEANYISAGSAGARATALAHDLLHSST